MARPSDRVALNSARTPASIVAAPARSLSINQQLCLLLVVHLVLWSWVGWSSRSNFDGPGDMVEAYAWAQGWQWGYYKHPPLSAWVTGLWFHVVPASHLGYSALAALNCAVGLAGLAALAREFLPDEWVLLAVAVASLAPGVTNLAMRFNANAILISTWPWAMAFFVRLMHRGRIRDAVACGVLCALAMLGKYFSGVMLVSLLVAALWQPAWRARLWSTPAALACLTFAVCMSPHAAWSAAQVEGPLQYARAAAGQGSAGQSVMRALTFALAQCVFPLLAFLILRLTLHGPARGRAFWHAVTAPLRPAGSAPWLLGMLPVLVTMAATVLTGARTASVWGLALAAGMALLAASRARDAGAEVDRVRLWHTLGIVWLSVGALAPCWWTARALLGDASVSEPREELALTVGRAWAGRYGGDIPWISGTRALAASVAFYAPQHPKYFSLWNMTIETPWVDSSAVKAEGGAIVCEPADEPCLALAETWSADRQTLLAAKSTRGFDFEPRRYVVFWLSPTATLAPHGQAVAGGQEASDRMHPRADERRARPPAMAG